MNLRSFGGVLAAAALALAACSGDDDGGGGGGGGGRISCTYEGDFCSQYTGPLTSEQRSQMSSLCGMIGGTFAATGCSTAGSVPGHCAYADTGMPGVTNEDYYYAANWTAAEAEADCLSWGGTWVD